MAEIATTIEEQIKILRNRGMEIKDEDKAIENLIDIGYFRLGFYWFPFEQSYPKKINRKHNFKKGTNINFAIKLYYFDFDLRNIILRYIIRIEVNFRTILVYNTSNKYKEDPFWFINPRYIDKKLIDNAKYIKSLAEVNKEIVIIQDRKTHKRDFSPAWKTLEFLTFGTIITIYDNLLDGGLKHNIAVNYGMQSSSQFSNYINTIRRLRNYCAHGKVLFDLKLPVAISNGPLGYLGNRKTSLYGAYKVFEYILSKVSKNRVEELSFEIKKSFERINYKEVKDVIFNNSGFTEDEINNL